MEDSRLRKRPVAATLAPSNRPRESDEGDKPSTAAGNTSGTRSTWIQRPSFSVLFLVQVIACFIYGCGFVWRVSLHNGSECEMTYSYRQFLDIRTNFQPPSQAAQNYKLYKFVDQRDPRYQQLLQDHQPLTGSSHCVGKSPVANRTTIVLYIPGHWGSYTQARSVGAHGTQWTRQRENPRRGQRAMMEGTWPGVADRLEDFIYEVYAVDFSEQGGALHGRLLELQSDFVAHSVNYLAVSTVIACAMLV